MLINRSGFRLFAEYDLGDALSAQLKKAVNEISQKEIDCENSKSFIESYLKEITIERLILDSEAVTARMEKAMIPAEYFPGTFMTDRGNSYEKPIAVFSVPFTGDKQLFNSRPSTFMMWSEEVAIEGNNLVFEIIVFSEDADKIKVERDGIISKINQQLVNINNQVDAYNASLPKNITDIVNAECKKRSSESDLLSKLNS